MKDNRPVESSTSELINRTPELRQIRDEMASWPGISGADRGNVRELVNLAALAIGLWKFRGCKDDDVLCDLGDRFLHAAALVAVEDEARLGGWGTVGDGVLEYEQEAVICACGALATLMNHQRALEQISHEYFAHTSDNWRSRRSWLSMGWRV